jgi:hypothetical protein
MDLSTFHHIPLSCCCRMCLPTFHQPQVTHLGLQVDYNMSTLQVYRNMALRSIQEYHNLEVLSYAWLTNFPDTEYPSWIPRWDVPLIPVIPLRSFLYDASLESEPRLLSSSTSDSLVVQGLCVGSILRTDTVLTLGEASSDGHPHVEITCTTGQIDVRVKDNCAGSMAECRQLRLNSGNACKPRPSDSLRRLLRLPPTLA